MAFQLGQRVGHYEFIDIVDSNPNRVAFRVRNLANNRFELLRVLGAAVQGDEERTKRFYREASVHARLVHPNIVAFYRATTLEGQFVITTELADGVTLAERLELGPLPLPVAISFFDQVLSALSCAHQHGIVHRNVSPASIIVTPDSSIKLAGFTYARGSIDPQLTQVGFTVGDVHYLSPEQVCGAPVLDPRCDIYAAGIVLYESITGRKPFDGKSQFDVLAAQVSDEPPPPSRWEPSLTPEWDAVVMKALAKEPSRRHQSAAEFRAALQSLGPSFPEPAAVFEAVTAKAGGAGVPSGPGRWDASLTWAVLAIAMFAVFFFVSGRQ
jgi:serine/threonine protein kinase